MAKSNKTGEFKVTDNKKEATKIIKKNDTVYIEGGGGGSSHSGAGLIIAIVFAIAFAIAPFTIIAHTPVWGIIFFILTLITYIALIVIAVKQRDSVISTFICFAIAYVPYAIASLYIMGKYKDQDFANSDGTIHTALTVFVITTIISLIILAIIKFVAGRRAPGGLSKNKIVSLTVQGVTTLALLITGIVGIAKGPEKGHSMLLTTESRINDYKINGDDLSVTITLKNVGTLTITTVSKMQVNLLDRDSHSYVAQGSAEKVNIGTLEPNKTEPFTLIYSLSSPGVKKSFWLNSPSKDKIQVVSAFEY